MKRLAFTIAIILGIAIGASAQNRGLFDMGPENPFATNNVFERNEIDGGLFPIFLSNVQHGTGEDQDVPLGSGALLLIGFGAAYALRKERPRRRED